MTGLIVVIAAAAMLTPLILARPLVAVPGGAAASAAWLAATWTAGQVPDLLLGVGSLAAGMCTAAYTVHLVTLLAGREKARAAEEAEREREERTDYLVWHYLALDNVPDEIAGGGL